jgi:hypothetical protein
MTPKQKAKELFSNFGKVTSKQLKKGGYRYNVDIAKQCALIAVSEIENELTDYGRRMDELQNMDGEWRFWDKVKEEIEKL